MTLKEKHELMLSLGKDAIICCDMDGVLAKWDINCTYESTWEPEYFLHRDLESAVRDALLLLIDAGFKSLIISAAYETGTSRKDKDCWLNNNNLEHLPRLFVPCGRNKADFIDAQKGTNYILLDDYNFNLIGWEETELDNAKFIAVKFLNGINGGSDVWKGKTIYHRSNAETIAHTLADIAAMA